MYVNFKNESGTLFSPDILRSKAFYLLLKSLKEKKKTERSDNQFNLMHMKCHDSSYHSKTLEPEKPHPDCFQRLFCIMVKKVIMKLRAFVLFLTKASHLNPIQQVSFFHHWHIWNIKNILWMGDAEKTSLCSCYFKARVLWFFTESQEVHKSSKSSDEN